MTSRRGRLLRAAAIAAVLELLQARPGFPQTIACDPAAALALDVVGGEASDLRREHDKHPHIVDIVEGTRNFTAPFDPATSSFTANLRGLTIPAADLSKLTLRLAGYRLDPKPAYTQRQRATCVAHIEIAPFRTWHVSVAVPGTSSAINVQVQSPKGSTIKKPTPIVIPRGLPEWGGSLDWSTRLSLEVFPSPGDNQDHYTVALGADNLDASGSDADNRATKCRSTPGRLCHAEEDIRKILRDKVKVPKSARGNDWFRQLEERQELRRIDELPLVPTIEFQLVRP
jgi:hypothetical protein